MGVTVVGGGTEWQLIPGHHDDSCDDVTVAVTVATTAYQFIQVEVQV